MHAMAPFLSFQGEDENINMPFQPNPLSNTTTALPPKSHFMGKEADSVHPAEVKSKRGEEKGVAWTPQLTAGNAKRKLKGIVCPFSNSNRQDV